MTIEFSIYFKKLGRIALAELEEVSGNLVAAKRALHSSFDNIPSGFTFSLLQRFVRRIEGLFFLLLASVFLLL